jgi:GrpB-like predicted nucleotidyltransferase (UPF0157 family)
MWHDLQYYIRHYITPMRKLQLQNHTPHWKTLYDQEIIRIQSFLKDELIKAHHIGSTAIPTIKAKPTIDILLEVKSIETLDAYTANFKKLGYEPKGEFGIPGRRFYQKGGDNRTHHIHAFETNNPEIQRHIRFRDYLINHPQIALEYQTLKLKLIEEFPNDPQAYTKAKSDFIQSIDKLISDQNKANTQTKKPS